MTSFSPAQVKQLSGKLDRRHVQSRKLDDREVDYIEGWFAIAEANAIFGFGGWDREMIHFERVFERIRGEATTCAYLARVRIIVRAGTRKVVREGTGWGAATSNHPADAHERAIKAAETDATKRALATFGNRFGLGLYDKEQAGVTPRPEVRFAILNPTGATMAAGLSPEAFCSGLRRIIEATDKAHELATWFAQNRPQIAELKTRAPNLRNARGEHFGDLLERLFQAKLAPGGSDRPGRTSARSALGDAVGPDDVGQTSARSDNEGETFARSTPDSATHPGHADETSPVSDHGSGTSARSSGRQEGDALARSGHVADTLAHSGNDNGTLPGSIPDEPVGAGHVGETFAHSDNDGGTLTRSIPGGPVASGQVGETSARADNESGTLTRSIPDAPVRSGDIGRTIPGETSVAAQPSPALEKPPLSPSRIANGIRIDKAALAIGVTRRLRDKEHLREVAAMPCLVCQAIPSHAHHLTFAQPRGLSLKVSDEFVVPLCAIHHNEVHRSGAEELWWKRAGTEPLTIARDLWEKRVRSSVVQPAHLNGCAHQI